MGDIELFKSDESFGPGKKKKSQNFEISRRVTELYILDTCRHISDHISAVNDQGS